MPKKRTQEASRSILFSDALLDTQEVTEDEEKEKKSEFEDNKVFFVPNTWYSKVTSARKCSIFLGRFTRHTVGAYGKIAEISVKF